MASLVDAVQDSIARKKISHSAIERRRRQRINEKISQLQRLLPDCADREGLQMVRARKRDPFSVSNAHF